MKLNLKIGVVAAVAAVLVAIGVFGFGSGSTTSVKADVNAGNVYLIPQHFIPPTAAGAADFSCADAAPNGTNTTNGALAINTTNFPPANTGFSLATAPTATSFPAGLPLVEINNVTSQNLNSSVLAPGTVSPLFTSNNFIYICVNTSAVSSQLAANGLNTGTINYDTVSARGNCGTALAPAAVGAGGCDGDVTFSAIVQSNMGFFDQPSCSNPSGGTVVGEWTADRCINTTGEGTAQLEIPNSVTNNVNTVIARFNCSSIPGLSTGVVFPITIQQDAGSFTFNVICKGEASVAATTIQAIPNTVEIIPARGNTSHSFIWVKIHDANGNPVFPGRDVDFRVTGAACAIETAGLGATGTNGNTPVLGTLGDGPNVLSFGSVIAMTSQLNAAAPGSYLNWEFSAPAQTPIDIFGNIAPGVTSPLVNFGFSPQQDFGKTIDGFALNGITPEASYAGAILSCNPAQAAGVTPGVATVSACVQVLNNIDACVTTTVKVIGPPASITVAASPTSVTCGEKSTITATVVDSIGQNVSDHTRVELVTNLGGVIGGTGAVAGFAANVAPVSSSVADTFGGVATAFLITSDVTSGPYEVIATSGGTTSGDFGSVLSIPATSVSFNQLLTPVALPGSFAPFTAFPTQSYLGGQFSTPPVSAQVTVNCALPVAAAPAPAPAPAIVAPRTGTGIIPPNTGDAGLVGSSSSSSWTFVALGGVFALTFAGLAAAKFARR